MRDNIQPQTKYKVVEWPRTMLKPSDPRIHRMVEIGDEAQLEEIRGRYESGEYNAEAVVKSMEIQSRLMMLAVAPETQIYLGQHLAQANGNSAWAERYGEGRASMTPDKSTMRTQFYMPAEMLDPEAFPTRRELCEIATEKTERIHQMAERQRGVIKVLGVRSVKLAKEMHFAQGELALLMASIAAYDSIVLDSNPDPSITLREAGMELILGAADQTEIYGEVVMNTALAREGSLSRLHIMNGAPSQVTRDVIKVATS